MKKSLNILVAIVLVSSLTSCATKEEAGALAGALGAEKVIYLTDVPGLLTDLDDPSSIIARASVPQLEAMIDDGTIAGGMIPKVASCIQAVRNGVHRAHILDGTIAHVLLLEIFTDAGIGTMVMKDRKDAP